LQWPGADVVAAAEEASISAELPWFNEAHCPVPFRGGRVMEFTFPQCRKCHEGDLVPLSDFGSQGASIEYKAWVCTNPNCLYNVKIRNGDIIINEPVSDGSMHNYRRGN
jgi:hypothetical protein